MNPLTHLQNFFKDLIAPMPQYPFTGQGLMKGLIGDISSIYNLLPDKLKIPAAIAFFLVFLILLRFLYDLFVALLKLIFSPFTLIVCSILFICYRLS